MRLTAPLTTSATSTNLAEKQRAGENLVPLSPAQAGTSVAEEQPYGCLHQRRGTDLTAATFKAKKRHFTSETIALNWPH